MNSKLLNVQHITTYKDCNSFLNVSKDFHATSSSIAIISTTDSDKRYFGFLHQNQICGIDKAVIYPKLFPIKNLEVGSNIFVNVESTSDKDLSIKSITISSKTNADAVFLRANVKRVLDNMLHQVRVVAINQEITLKIDNVFVNMSVVKMDPEMEYGLLMNGTEIIFELETSNSASTDSTQSNVKSKMFRVVRRNNVNGNGKIKHSDKALRNNDTASYKVSSCPELGAKMKKDDTTPKVQSVHLKLEEEISTERIEPTVALSDGEMKNLGVEIGSRVIIEPSCEKSASNIVHTSESGHIPEMIGAQFLVLRAKIIESWKCMKFKHCCNTLITGPPGSGKSFFLETLTVDATSEGYFSTIFNCQDLKGKSAKAIYDILVEEFSRCANHEPAILFLDNLDAMMIGDAILGESAYTSRLARMLCKFARGFTTSSRVTLVATAASVASISKYLADVRGPRLFEIVLDIPELASEDRESFLNLFGMPSDSEIVVRTKGFHVQDLVNLRKRAKFRMIMNEKSSPITKECVLEALKDSVPRSLQGINFEDNVSYSWKDVGGMNSVKKELLQVFEWPIKYASIFNSCPLRLDTGALLYGMPGSGKTYIAGALAKKCGMHFISVKGPELLSKYIGKSEAGVRDVFDRAQRAKPCLIFFDELDSLTPKRGQDSLGVTDRVVNQMLTQLDGVESRAGVWVLGATTRPDLIDPALLRPGRLGKAIHCPLPNEEERLDILNLLKESLPLRENVTLEGFASITNHYSCADLKGLLSTAHFLAEKDVGENVDEVVIDEGHIMEAIKITEPSLTTGKVQFYTSKFEMFEKSKSKGREEERKQYAKKVAYA